MASKDADSTTTRDPEALVREIEATREDLAETIDAIADRISPKRVAGRGKETVKEKTAAAREVIGEKVAAAREAVAERTAGAREQLGEKTLAAKETVGATTSTARQALDEQTAALSQGGSPASVLDSGSGARGGSPLDALPVPREALVAGAVAALLGLWLWRRRR